MSPDASSGEYSPVNDEVGLDLLQLMENARRALAWHARDVADGPALVVAGDGGNGGGGLACARHLRNRDVPVSVVLGRAPEDLTEAAAHQHGILDEMDVETRVGTDGFEWSDRPSVIVDALVGDGLASEVRAPARGLIESANRQEGAAVSLDASCIGAS